MSTYFCISPSVSVLVIVYLLASHKVLTGLVSIACVWLAQPVMTAGLCDSPTTSSPCTGGQLGLWSSTGQALAARTGPHLHCSNDSTPPQPVHLWDDWDQRSGKLYPFLPAYIGLSQRMLLHIKV